jgi:hypothetical protein
MRLFSPQLTMPNLQQRSFQPVANVNTQREGGVTAPPIYELLKSEMNILREYFNLSSLQIHGKALRFQLSDTGHSFVIKLTKIPQSFEDYKALLNENTKRDRLRSLWNLQYGKSRNYQNVTNPFA